MLGIYCETALLESEMIFYSGFGPLYWFIEPRIANITPKAGKHIMEQEDKKKIESRLTRTEFSLTCANSRSRRSEELDADALIASLRAVEESRETSTVDVCSPPKMMSDLTVKKRGLLKHCMSLTQWSTAEELDAPWGGSPSPYNLKLI